MENEFTFDQKSPCPQNIHNIGVFFPQFFDKSRDYYRSITSEHRFQSLTESNKTTNAFRKGIYLTRVEQDGNDIRFNLLRCSTNLNGPTDNFRDTDEYIISRLQDVAPTFFKYPVNFNHVLAQIYINSTCGDKQKKARIKRHSDKTKDMPRDALMAFCSFYEGFNNGFNDLQGVKQSTSDPFDYCYKDTSVLTRLRFRLKEAAIDTGLEKQFDIVLYPNSVFIMSLKTNRLYTHEIVPSVLPVDKIPTRMGYVVRCSNTSAVHKNGRTYIVKNNKLIPLEPPTCQGIEELKHKYYRENTTIDQVTYDGFYFSLNNGDYTKPIL